MAEPLKTALLLILAKVAGADDELPELTLAVSITGMWTVLLTVLLVSMSIMAMGCATGGTRRHCLLDSEGLMVIS